MCVCVQWDTFWKSELNARPMMTHPCIVYAHVALIGNISTTHSIHTIAAQTLATNHLVVSSFVPIDRKYINSNSEPCKYLPHSRCRRIERERRDEAKKTNATVNAYFHMQSQKSDYLHLIHSSIFFSVNSWSDNIHVLCNAYKNTSRSTLNALTRSHARTHSLSLVTHSHWIFHLYL